MIKREDLTLIDKKVVAEGIKGTSNVFWGWELFEYDIDARAIIDMFRNTLCDEDSGPEWCEGDEYVDVSQGCLNFYEFGPIIICELKTKEYGHIAARRLFKKGMDYQEIADYIDQDALLHECPEV